LNFSEQENKNKGDTHTHTLKLTQISNKDIE
jgi:hypothetical protein